MDKIPVNVILKSKTGRKVEIRDEKAWVVIEAIKILLEDRNVPKMGPIQIDLTLPEEFDFAEAVAMAISLGYKTPQEIADYLKREIQRHL
jgi:hypothetical protein